MNTDIKLVFPKPWMEEEALAYRREHFEAGEREIHGDGGLDLAESYAEWLKKLEGDLARRGGGYVPAVTYFAFHADRIVGTIQIRLELNEYLRLYAGHIGYGVRPSERRKGYATAMLSLALDECRGRRIENVLVTCDRNNHGSARAIINNGGVFEGEAREPDGDMLRRYWIRVSPRIRRATEADLPACAEAIRKSFATVAALFGWTEENAPTHPAFMTCERLRSDFTRGVRMYALALPEGDFIGFAAFERSGEDFYLERLAVLPEYRRLGYGARLVDFICGAAAEYGAEKVKIGIIDEYTSLKSWYGRLGFIHTGVKKFAHLPFTTGYMERDAVRNQNKNEVKL